MDSNNIRLSKHLYYTSKNNHWGKNKIIISSNTFDLKI
jgi:hypothetical protein